MIEYSHQGPEETLRKLSGANDRAFDRSNRNIEKLVSIGPGYFAGIVVMVVPEE